MNDANTPPKPGEPTLDRAFQLLANQLNKRGPSVQRTVMAHVRAVTGRNIPLPLLHKDESFTEQWKKQLYKLLVTAVVTGNYANLQGDIAQGDKVIDGPKLETTAYNPVEDNGDE